MDIKLVRRFFQTPWDIPILTENYTVLDSAVYSLQQPTLNSDDHFLHVSTTVNPDLVGDLIVVGLQRFIVHKLMLERSNKNMLIYKLVVAYDDLVLHELIKYKNAIGTYVDSSVIDHNCACALADYGKKERITPSAQPLDSYEQEFMIAFKQLPDYRGAYTLTYHGIKYKVASFELDGGLLKIRATENL